MSRVDILEELQSKQGNRICNGPEAQSMPNMYSEQRGCFAQNRVNEREVKGDETRGKNEMGHRLCRPLHTHIGALAFKKPTGMLKKKCDKTRLRFLKDHPGYYVENRLSEDTGRNRNQLLYNCTNPEWKWLWLPPEC